MGLEILDLIFEVSGRGVCWLIGKMIGKSLKLSSGSYEVIGFVTSILAIIVSIAIAGS